MQQTYSLLRSKTFWTLVFMFVVDGFMGVSGQLNPTVVMVVNGAFTVIASYFHLQTGTSTTGTN